MLSAAGGACAQSVPPVTAADLQRSCSALVTYAAKGGELSADVTSCAAYLKGLRDGVEVAAQRTTAERPFCAEGVGLDEMARAVVKYLQDNPQNVRRLAVGEAMAALGRAYPCRR